MDMRCIVMMMVALCMSVRFVSGVVKQFLKKGEREEEVVRNVIRKKWILEEPTDCKSPFPCFGEVREIEVLESVTLLVSVCQLKPLWRKPRLIQETYNGVTIVLSPGYFSNQIMCVWNITFPEEQALFVSSNYNNSQLETLNEVSGVECDGEYIVLEWNGSREITCLEPQHHSQMNNNILFLNNIKIIFRSFHEGTFGNGLRLDTACYPITLPQQIISELNCSQNSNYLPGQDHMILELSSSEEVQLMEAFSLHFDLHMLMDKCSRSARECGIYINKYMTSSLLDRHLNELQSVPDTLSSLLHTLKLTTLYMYGY